MSSFNRIYHLSIFLRQYQLLKLLLVLFVGSSPIFSQIPELSHKLLFLHKQRKNKNQQTDTKRKDNH